MNINDVNRGIKKHKAKKRIGRGSGSGHGKTSGRGHKGQGSRAGFSMGAAFEGGQMPIARRIPKRGFNNKWALKVVIINVGDIEELFNDGDTINPAVLKERGIAKQQYDVLKILGDGELSKKITVEAHRFSKSAKEKIEKAGGTVTELPGKKPVVKNKMKAKS